MGNYARTTRIEAMRRFFELLKDRKGATAIEYGLIVAMIFLAMAVGLQVFADSALEMWDHVAEEVREA